MRARAPPSVVIRADGSLAGLSPRANEQQHVGRPLALLPEKVSLHATGLARGWRGAEVSTRGSRAELLSPESGAEIRNRYAKYGFGSLQDTRYLPRDKAGERAFARFLFLSRQ